MSPVNARNRHSQCNLLTPSGLLSAQTEVQCSTGKRTGSWSPLHNPVAGTKGANRNTLGDQLRTLKEAEEHVVNQQEMRPMANDVCHCHTGVEAWYFHTFSFFQRNGMYLGNILIFRYWKQIPSFIFYMMKSIPVMCQIRHWITNTLHLLLNTNVHTGKHGSYCPWVPGQWSCGEFESGENTRPQHNDQGKDRGPSPKWTVRLKPHPHPIWWAVPVPCPRCPHTHWPHHWPSPHGPGAMPQLHSPDSEAQWLSCTCPCLVCAHFLHFFPMSPEGKISFSFMLVVSAFKTHRYCRWAKFLNELYDVMLMYLFLDNTF